MRIRKVHVYNSTPPQIRNRAILVAQEDFAKPRFDPWKCLKTSSVPIGFVLMDTQRMLPSWKTAFLVYKAGAYYWGSTLIPQKTSGLLLKLPNETEQEYETMHKKDFFLHWMSYYWCPVSIDWNSLESWTETSSMESKYHNGARELSVMAASAIFTNVLDIYQGTGEHIKEDWFFHFHTTTVMESNSRMMYPFQQFHMQDKKVKMLIQPRHPKSVPRKEGKNDI